MAANAQGVGVKTSSKNSAFAALDGVVREKCESGPAAEKQAPSAFSAAGQADRPTRLKPLPPPSKWRRLGLMTGAGVVLLLMVSLAKSLFSGEGAADKRKALPPLPTLATVTAPQGQQAWPEARADRPARRALAPGKRAVRKAEVDRNEVVVHEGAEMDGPELTPVRPRRVHLPQPIADNDDDGAAGAVRTFQRAALEARERADREGRAGRSDPFSFQLQPKARPVLVDDDSGKPNPALLLHSVQLLGIKRAKNGPPIAVLRMMGFERPVFVYEKQFIHLLSKGQKDGAARAHSVEVMEIGRTEVALRFLEMPEQLYYLR